MNGSTVGIHSDTRGFESAAALAEAFGPAILESTWWPADIGGLTYNLDIRPQSRTMYRIGSLRQDGRPICVIGRLELAGDPMRGLPPANWHPITELASCSGVVSNERDAVRAVVMRDGQTVQLIGYMTEAEIVQAVTSLQLVGPR
jgi:hypothetical protein